MVIETVLALASAAFMGSKSKDAVQGVVHAFRRRSPIARDVAQDFAESRTLGERFADRLAELGGSWSFVIGFFVFLAAWTILNTLALPAGQQFDPYPFIFLNLVLSMLAAVQAPIIMMSQNRQAQKDRIEARHNFEVNLKAELEILALHEKLDHLHREHGAQLASLHRLLEVARTERDWPEPTT